jgi:hypothetical protein
MQLPDLDSAGNGHEGKAAAQLFWIASRSGGAAGMHLSSKGIQMDRDFFASGNAGASAADKVERGG